MAVCWDALDGSTLFELIDGNVLKYSGLVSTQLLMIFWYISVGFRMATIICALLPPTEYGYKLVAFQPLQLSAVPTVDRTLQALRVRSFVIIVMSFAEFYAAGLRITLWIQGLLTTIQQEMALKNILFLSSVYSAYSMRINTIERDWNSRDLGFGFIKPSRSTQIIIIRWIFVTFYLLQGGLLSAILIKVSNGSNNNVWVANVVSDILLMIIFIVYFKNVYRQSAHSVHSTSFCSFMLPKESFVLFPAYPIAFFSTILMINMYGARVPAIYYNSANCAASGSGLLWTYDNALLIVNLSIIVIGALATYWSISFMLFKKEFTRSPG